MRSSYRYLKILHNGFKVDTQEISEEDYVKILIAKNILSNALKLEQTLLIPIENLIEFEKSIVNSIVDCLYNFDIDYGYINNLIMTFHRHLSNTILTTELFLDKGKGFYWRMFGDNISKSDVNDKKMEFDKLTNIAYDTSSAYRVCNTLINYLKHNNLVIHGLNRGADWNTERTHMAFRMNAYMLKSELISTHDRFAQMDKKGFLQEVPEKIEILPLVKEYISKLHEILVKLRVNAKSSIDSARALIKSHLGEKYEDDYLHLVKEDSDGKKVEEHTLTFNWEDVRIQLIEKYKYLANLECRGVGDEYNKQQNY